MKPLHAGVLLFYCVQTGFYIQAIHFLAFHEVTCDGDGHDEAQACSVDS